MTISLITVMCKGEVDMTKLNFFEEAEGHMELELAFLPLHEQALLRQIVQFNENRNDMTIRELGEFGIDSARQVLFFKTLC
jgi:hypothetical protein